MDMHTPGRAPDWNRKRADRVNVWQRLALASHGVVTPGNIISLAGLVIVVIGAVKLYQGEWQLALLLIALGRAADLADGFAAQRTGTKSRLGEIVDTSCDKVGVFALVVALVMTQTIQYLVIVPIALYQLYQALFAVIWGRKYRLHTTRSGKLAMAASLFVILAAIFSANLQSRAIFTVYIVSTVVFAGLALASIYSYWKELRREVAISKKSAAWTKEVTDVLHIYNPHATNYLRAEKALKALCGPAGWKPQRFDVTKQTGAVKKHIRSAKSGQTLLVTVAGGDGTVSGVVNMLIELSAESKLSNLYVLPLWGGNANDFSNMLNGTYSASKMQRLLTAGRPAALPCIKLDVSDKKNQRTMYACCYASFGASAFAARRLEAQRFSTSSALRWFPPLLVLRELTFVIRALIDSPMRVAEINSRETSFYEHTLINGSRIAKVNRVPVQLDEPVFFHALVERKHPSVVINVLRILFGRPDTVYARKKSLTFTTKQPLDAQIDGEVTHFDKDTHVSAHIVYPTSVSFISTSLSGKSQ